METVAVLAIMVYQGILTKSEAYAIKKCLTEGVTNSNLSQMIAKIEKALKTTEPDIKTIDATSFIN